MSPNSNTPYGFETPLIPPPPPPGLPNDTYVYSEDNIPARRPTDVLHHIRDFTHGQQYENADDDYWEDEDEDDETRFINFAMLSHMAVQLRDRVPRGTHVKGSIPYSRAFTGKDIVVSTIVTNILA
jgi:hypothetical protein